MQTDAREAAHIDSDMGRVLHFIHSSGVGGALIEEAIFRLTERLSLVEDRLAGSDFDPVRVAAEDIALRAGEIGLELLAAVARDLAGCAARRDPVATPAVAARLVRVGTDSIFGLACRID